MALCCICERRVDQWLPHTRLAQRSRFMVMMNTIGSNLAVFWCPHCRSTDRDRHLWLYLTASGLTDCLPGAAVLHIAPERPLEALIEARGLAAYERGDLHSMQPHHRRLNVEALAYEDASFDLVIANHVLEHVADPLIALRELHRVLRPLWVLVAQTPYAPGLARTFEMTTPVTPDFATLFYGQDDHRRLFGGDLPDWFRAAGFEGQPVPHDTVLAGMDGAEFGINPGEPFFVFPRPAALAAAA